MAVRGQAAALGVGQTIAAQDATWRTAVTVAYVAWSMLGVAAVALFASTVTDSPARPPPSAPWPRWSPPVSSTCWTRPRPSSRTCQLHYWLAFVDLFRTPVLWRDVNRGFAVQAIYIAVFLGLAWANFATMDVKSQPGPPTARGQPCDLDPSRRCGPATRPAGGRAHRHLPGRAAP